MTAHLLRLGLIELPKLSNILRDLLSATEQGIGPASANALEPRDGFEIKTPWGTGGEGTRTTFVSSLACEHPPRLAQRNGAGHWPGIGKSTGIPQ